MSSALAGRVLLTNLRAGLSCPTCRVQHNFPGEATVAAAPRTFALISSLELLQQRGAAGGLLAPESLDVGAAVPSALGSVHSGTLNLHNRQIQVTFSAMQLGHHAVTEIICTETQHKTKVMVASLLPSDRLAFSIMILQVVVKKLQTAQVPPAALTQFKLKLHTLAFASSMCSRLCRLLGFVVTDGNLCLVMRRYQQSLQHLLASSPGKREC